jgi:hypothetical protein
VGRNEHDGKGGCTAAQLTGEGSSVHAGHLHIRHEKVESSALGGEANRICAARRGCDSMAITFECTSRR